MKLDKSMFLCIVSYVTPSHVAAGPGDSLPRGRYFILVALVLLLLFARTVPANAEATLTEVVAAVNADKVVNESVKLNTQHVFENTSTISTEVASVNTKIRELREHIGGSEAGSINFRLEKADTELATTVTDLASEITKLTSINTNTEDTKTNVTSLQTALESKGFTEGHPLFVSGAGGGGGGTEVTAFGTSAQSTLSEFKEQVETVGWCVIGTMLGISVAIFAFVLLRTRST